MAQEARQWETAGARPTVRNKEIKLLCVSGMHRDTKRQGGWGGGSRQAGGERGGRRFLGTLGLGWRYLCKVLASD